MIKINVAQQLKENTGSIRRYRIDEFDDNGFHIHGEMEFLRTDRSILAHGILNTIAVGTCSRCLQEFNYPLALNIEEEYFIARDATGKTESPHSSFPIEYTTYSMPSCSWA